MKRIRNLVVAGCSVFLLCQCATQDAVQNLGYQLRAVNQKVEDIKSTTVSTIQKRQAGSLSRIDAIQNDVLQLRGSLEENAHQETLFREQSKENLAALQSTVEKYRAENQQRLKLIEERLDRLAFKVGRLSQARIRAAEERAQAAARRAEEARQRTVMAATAAGSVINIVPAGRKVKIGGRRKAARASVSPTAKSSPRKNGVAATAPPVRGMDLFSQAMKQYRAKKYADAYKTFEQVLAGHPKGDKAAETLFFMGECLFAQGEYDLAILDYQKVISNHAKNRRTPTALLKQGISFEKLTDRETAKIIYKKLLAEYPKSPEAATARKHLNSMQ